MSERFKYYEKLYGNPHREFQLAPIRHISEDDVRKIANMMVDAGAEELYPREPVLATYFERYYQAKIGVFRTVLKMLGQEQLIDKIQNEHRKRKFPEFYK